jgi:hypothetical protein
MYMRNQMKQSALCVFFVTALLLLSGCPDETPQPVGNNGLEGDPNCIYGVSEIHIVGLTTLTPDPEDAFASKMEVYIDLVDSFGSRIKAPGTFRFELHEFVARSGKIEGKRFFLEQPDIDLTDAAANNDHWQDYLRAYVFNLKPKFRVAGGTEYILQVTFFTGDERRLVDMFQIRARD